LYSEGATSSYILLTGSGASGANLQYVGQLAGIRYFRCETSKFTGSQPALGDFIYFDLFDMGIFIYIYHEYFNKQWLLCNEC
jgi:hypothetical protein